MLRSRFQYAEATMEDELDDTAPPPARRSEPVPKSAADRDRRVTVPVPAVADDEDAPAHVRVHIVTDDAPDLLSVDEAWGSPVSTNTDSIPPSRKPTRHPSARPTAPAHGPPGSSHDD
jgi:hypothetical protein